MAKYMSILIWTPSLSVNINSIDNQHQKLFELANAFYNELYKAADQVRLIEKLKELTDYTIFHFQTEENLLLQFNYPDTTSHKKEHSEFVNELATLKSQILSNELVISVGVINLLRNSIINHIFVADKDLVKYVSAKQEYNNAGIQLL
jgi:hemerythrin-like metal-binding protein